MISCPIDRLSNDALIQRLDTLDARDRRTTAELLVCLGEIQARGLYLAAGYSSMFAWCVGERRYSEDVALRRMRAARAAHRFPWILDAITDGRQHVSGLSLLARFLTESNATELLEAAEHKSSRAIELMLAQRFPRPDVPTLIRPLSVPPALQCLGTPHQHQCWSVLPESDPAQLAERSSAEAVSEQSGAEIPAELDAPSPPPVPCELAAQYARVTPLAPERFALQVTIGQDTREKLQRARDLLGHQVPSGELAEVLDRALDALIEKLEARKCGATSRPKAPRSRTNPDSRRVPAAVRRAVWERDCGQCTFVSDTGRRCEARSMLEFDHVDEFASGGNATISGIQLRCRAHNQFTAELAYGAEFMRDKRTESRRVDAEQREQITASTPVETGLGAAAAP